MHQGSCLGASAMEEEEKRMKVLKLFGVNINGGERMANAAAGAVAEAEEEEEALRKSFSTGNLASCTAAAAATPSVSAADAGYVSDGGLMQSSSGRRRKNEGHERKRGTPWTEEEHRTFLAGLEKLGKGDWRGISRNFVITRTPTQVASHAQKYFLRQRNPGKKKRRSSLFDVVIGDDKGTDGVEPSGFPSSNLLVKHEQAGSLMSMSTVEDSQGISQKFNEIDARGTQFQTNITFGPDLLGLSLTYPHNFQAQPSSQATPSVDAVSDLELRIAPPQPHNVNKLSTSQGAAEAIRVV